MTGWIDFAEEMGMPYGKRMYKVVDGLTCRLGQYFGDRHRKWHWWVSEPDETLPLGKVHGSGVVPTQEWAAESAEAFAKKFLTLL